MAGFYAQNRKSVVAERFDDEVVLVQLETGAYYSLSRTAAAVWTWLDCGLPVPEIARRLAAEDAGADSVAAHVDEFVSSLEAEGLIVPRTEPGPASDPPDIPLSGYDKPSFQKFDDMADLILLDPIHDVDAEGWPLRPANKETAS